MDEFENDKMEMPLDCQKENSLESNKEEIVEINKDEQNIKHLHNMLMLCSSIVQTINDIKYQYERFKKLVYKHGGFHHLDSLISAYSQYLSLQKIIKQYVNVLEIGVISIQDYYCSPDAPSGVVEFYNDLQLKNQYIKNMERELSGFKFERMDHRLAIYQLSYFLEELSKYYPIDGDSDDIALSKITTLANSDTLLIAVKKNK